MRSVTVFGKLGIALAMVSFAAFGDNGSNLIGITPASQAMGGTGVANYTSGMDALYKNPALLSELDQKDGATSIEIAGTFIGIGDSAQAAGSPNKNSTALNPFLPEISAAYRVNEQFSVGLGLLSYGGDATNYVNQGELSQVSGSFQLIKLVPAVSYTPIKELSIGAGPYFAYGALALNYEDYDGIASGRKPHGATSVGYQAGAKWRPLEGLTIGASFTSAVKFGFQNIANFDLFALPPNVNPFSPIQGLDVTQPMEIAGGISYAVLPELKVTFDYRFIDWSSNDPYTQLGWGGQSVIGVGGQYTWEKAVFRIGYNYGKSPISNTSGESGSATLQGHQIDARYLSLMDVASFPGISEHHFAAGAGYQFSEEFNADAAFMFSPTATVTRAGSDYQGAYSYQANLNLWTVSGRVAYKF